MLSCIQAIVHSYNFVGVTGVISCEQQKSFNHKRTLGLLGSDHCFPIVSRFKTKRFNKFNAGFEYSVRGIDVNLTELWNLD